jgi:hypothetical protein
MSFLTRAEAEFTRSGANPLALDAWRDAERLVRERWEQYRSAPEAARRGAFAAYTAALHAEEAAARDLEFLTLASAA